MNTQRYEFLRYYIRLTNLNIFNALVASAEGFTEAEFETRREDGFYVLRTNDQYLWHDLFIYGQMLAQAQGEHIEAGQE